MLQDYRPASYRRIAKQSAILSKRAKRRAAEQIAANKEAIATTTISIKPEYVTTGSSGQKSISGTIEKNVEIKPKLEETTAKTTTQTLQEPPSRSQTSNLKPGSVRVYVSEGVARKLDPNVQGTSKDSYFYVDVERTTTTEEVVEPTKTTSYVAKSTDDSIANPEDYFIGETEKRRASRKQKFKIAKERVLPVITSEDSSFVQKGSAVVQTAGLYTFGLTNEAFQRLIGDRVYAKDGNVYVGSEQLVAGGVALTTYATPKVSGVVDKKIDVKVDSVVRQESSVGGGSTTGKILPGGEVTVKYKQLGIVPRSKTYKVSGTFSETTQKTGSVGRQSGQPIYSTKGGGDYTFTTKSGSKVADITATTKGSEVGGIGNRMVGVDVSTKTGSSRELFVERYAGAERGGGQIVYGGGVSSKGQSVYVGSRELSYPSVRYSTVFDSINKEITVVQKPTTVSFYNVKSASANTPVGYRGLNTQFGDVGIYSKLVGEQPISVGKVSDVARQQATSVGSAGTSTAQVQYPSSFGVLNQKSILKSAASQVVDSQVSSVNVVPSVAPVVKSSVKVTPTSSSVVLNDVVGSAKSKSMTYIDYDVGSGARVMPAINSSIAPISGVSPVVGLASTNKSQSKVGSIGKTASIVGQSVSPVSIQVPAVEVVSKPAVKQSTASLLQNVSSTPKATGFVPTRPPVFNTVPTVVPKFPGFILASKGIFGVEVRRRGVFKRVGTFGSLKSAISRGVGVVRGGLGATFRIRKGGAGGSILNVGRVSPEFYTKSSGEVVQRRRFRLGTRGEISEIGYERKRKRYY